MSGLTTFVIVILLLAVLIGLALSAVDGLRGGNRPSGADDTRWKAGMFYYDREDSRLVVPKRFGIGRTLNYGRTMAWVITFAPLVIAVLLSASRQR